MVGMMRSFNKPDVVKRSIFNPPNDLYSSIYLFGTVGCLDEETEIYIENNSNISKCKLKDLPEKFNVISYNIIRKRKRVSEAIKIDSGMKECFEIEFENGEKVIATEEHIFFTTNMNEVKVEDLKVGDEMFFAERIYTKCYGKNNVYSRPEIIKNLKIKHRITFNNPTEQMLEGYKKISKYAKSRWQGKNNNWARPDVIAKIKARKNLPENKKRLSEMFSGENNPMFGKVAYPPIQFIKELNHNVRSSWEKEVCIKLKNNKINYKYEPTHFRLIIDGKMCSYTPDIQIDNIFLEVKGPLFDWQIKKMREFAKDNKLILITNKSNFKHLQDFKVIDYEKFIKEDFDINGIFKN